MLLLLAMQIHFCKLLAGRRWGLGIVPASVYLCILLVYLQFFEHFAEGHNALKMATVLVACLYGSLWPASDLAGCLTSCP